MKLSNFNCQWIKAYWILFNIFQGLWEPKKINVKFHKMTSYTWNFQNFTCVFTVLVKFDIYFLRLPWEIVFGVITANTSLSPWKVWKRKPYSLNFSCTRFLTTDNIIKLLNFLMDFVLIFCPLEQLQWFSESLNCFGGRGGEGGTSANFG